MVRHGLVASCVLVWICLICVSHAAEPRLIDDFNDGQVTWSSWVSPGADKPTLTISSDAAEGAGSLLVEVPESGETTLVCRLALPAPEGCDAISFWVKRVSGNIACDVQLEEDPKLCQGVDCFRTSMPVPSGDQWTRVVVPFERFRYSYTMHGEGNQQFEKDKLWAFAFAVYHQEPFAFKLDYVEFVNSADVSPAQNPAAAEASGNLLTGNTSLELGTSGWQTDGAVDASTAAVGARSLKCNGAGVHCATGRIKPDRPYTLSFYAKARTAGTINVSAWMNYSTVLNRQLPLTSQWTRLTVELAPMAQPIGAGIFFGTTDPNEPIWLDAVQLEEGATATAYRDPDPVVIQATSGARSEVVVLREGKPLTLDVAFFNARCPNEALPLSVDYTVSEATLGPIGRSTLQLDLETGKTSETTLELLPTMQPGYYTVRFVVRDRTGSILNEYVSPVAVVREPNRIAIDESFFGMHTDGLYAIGSDALHAIGVNWIRHGGALWDGVEKEPGQFNMPKGLAVIEQGFGALVTMLTVPPPAWARGADGFPASPDLIKNYIEKVLATYKDEITYFDFHNEPDLTLPQVAHRARSFAALLNAAHPSFQAAGKKLVFDVCGDGHAFTAEVIKDAADSFDVYAPHPYANPRYLGPDDVALGPEVGNMQSRLREFIDLYQSHMGGREFWIGELGWGLDARASCDSRWAARFAAYLARAHLVARSFPQIKRLIWFRDIGCTEGGLYEYGIWRHQDGVKPLPPVAAYATVAKLLDGATPLPIISDYDIKIYAYRKDDHVVLAAWDSLDDDTQDPLRVEVPLAEAEVWTMTGAAAPRKPGDDGVALMTISANPSYAILNPDALPRLVDRINSAVMNRRPATVEVAAPSLTTLSLSIRNRLSAPYDGSVDLWLTTADGHRTDLAAGLPVHMPAGGSMPLTLTLQEPLGLTGNEVGVALTAAAGGSAVEIRKPLATIAPCHRRQATPGEFLDAPLPQDAADLIVLDRREQVLPADPTIGWKSPENLSARARLSWDEQYLYFAADVTDDVHAQQAVDGDIWRGDSVQLAIDTRNDAQPGRNYDNNDYEYGLALGSEGRPIVWCWQAPPGAAAGPIENCPVRIERIDDRTVYRAALPWSRLAPLQPKAGTVFNLNFIVADNDGLGRRYWIGLSPGIAEAKLPDCFRRFVLVE